MGKIITGQELINIFKGCCSGQTQSFTDADYIAGIQESMYLKNVENSGRCPALNGSIDTVFDPTMFWNQMYGGDTGYEFYGDYQLEWTSGYLGLVDTQLVDSTYVPDFQSQMLCTNLTPYNTIYFNDAFRHSGSGSGFIGNASVTIRVTIGDNTVYVHSSSVYCDGAGFSMELSGNDRSDYVFAGSNNIPKWSSTYKYTISISLSNLVLSGYEWQSPDVEIYAGTTELPSTANFTYTTYGTAISVTGNTTLTNILNITSIDLIGTWNSSGGGSGSNEYDFLIYEGANVATSSYGSNNTMAVGNVIRTQSSLASTTANLKTSNFGNTTYYVNIYALDWENGELKLSWVGNAAPAGNYWIGFDLKYNNTVYYRMYMPLTVGSGGSISNGSGSYILDLSSVKNTKSGDDPNFYRTVRNTTSRQYYVWNYSSSGPQSSPIAAGGTSSYAMLLSTLYVLPYTSGACTVKTGVESSTYTISSDVSNKTVNIIPTNFSSSFGTLLTRIADKGTDFYVQLS